MAVIVFGVTYTTVRNHHFPQLSDFSASSNPTSTTVTEMVAAAGAELAGYLVAEGLTPSSLDDDTGTDAYAWCAETVRIGAAFRAARAMTSQDPEVVRAWEDDYRERLKRLDELGATALGSSASGGEEPNGPRTHIDHHDLDTGDTDDISDVIPRFRRSDML